MALRFRRGNSDDRPAGGTVAGEPRFDLDTGKLFVDDGEVNVEITPNATNVDPVVAELLGSGESATRAAVTQNAEVLREALGASMVGNAVFTGDAQAGRNALSAAGIDDIVVPDADNVDPVVAALLADQNSDTRAALALLKPGVFTYVDTVPDDQASTGTKNQIAWDLNYVYLCVADNTWRRWALGSSW